MRASYALTPERAATRIQSCQRRRQGHALADLEFLAFRVESHYRTVDEQQQTLFDAEQHSAPVMHGAVMRLEGKLLKQSGLGWQQRNCTVDNFRFNYLSRHGESKSIGERRATICFVLVARHPVCACPVLADLTEVGRVDIVSQDRLEFTIHMRAGRGKHRSFRWCAPRACVLDQSARVGPFVVAAA